MFINKIGKYHIDNGLNCQDFGAIWSDRKWVLDGCSESIHSDAGVKMFSHMYSDPEFLPNAHRIMKRLISSFEMTRHDIKNFLCFTILHVFETDEVFSVEHCGDGYIIAEKHTGEIIITKLDDGEYPKYYAYNFIDPEFLTHYKEGVDFTNIRYSKEIYKNVGVATDGLRYAFEDKWIYEEFLEILKSGKEVAMKRFINRNIKYFKDDITIAF